MTSVPDQKDLSENLLIVFTDEVESTPHDLGLTAEKDILRPRVKLFGIQLAHIGSMQWLVLKSVGDQLVLLYQDGCLVEGVVSMCRAWREARSKAKRKKIRSSLRVAIHRPITNDSDSSDPVVRGGWLKTELTSRLTGNGEKKDLAGLWPTCGSLDDDLFGMGMTYASRLCSLPKGCGLVSTY